MRPGCFQIVHCSCFLDNMHLIISLALIVSSINCILSTAFINRIHKSSKFLVSGDNTLECSSVCKKVIHFTFWKKNMQTKCTSEGLLIDYTTMRGQIQAARGYLKSNGSFNYVDKKPSFGGRCFIIRR